MKDEEIVYNCICINGCFSKIKKVKAKKDEVIKCEDCGEHLKVVGIASHNLKNFG